MKSSVIFNFLIFVTLIWQPIGGLCQDRGMFFSKKTYIEEPLPKFEEVKDLLPKPVCEEHPEWVNLYWQAWATAFSKLHTPAQDSPLVSNWIDEGLSPQIFQWDTNLMALFGRYAHHIFPFINSHDNFYASQHADGMICRVINESDGTDHFWGQGINNARAINPPLFGWAEVSTYCLTGNKVRFDSILSPLEHYAEWIDSNRRDTTLHHLYWSNGQASGMDNTPRDTGRLLPGDGWDEHSAYDTMGWIDMSTQMVMLYQNLSFICSELSLFAKAKAYEKKAKEIADDINEWMWDEKTGLYYDITPIGDKTTWITAATFWPMLAGVATPNQCAKLVENLKNPELFWTEIPVPTLACNQPEYDRMGNYWKGGVWAPTNYMIVEGLKRNGYNSEARELACKYLNAINRVYEKTHTFWEVYSPEIFTPATNASGVDMVLPDFVGWTGLAPISMLIETIIGIEADAKTNTIDWRIESNNLSGIENLRFNGNRVNLLANLTADGLELQILAEKEVNIKILFDNHEYDFSLLPNKKLNEFIPIASR